MTLTRHLPPRLMLVLAVALAGCTSTGAPAATSTPSTNPTPTEVQTTVPTMPPPEPTATSVANCMDADVHADLTASPPLDWGAVPQAERDRLADELEAYDFSDRPGGREFIDLMIDRLRSGGGLDPGFINSVLAGEIHIVAC